MDAKTADFYDTHADVLFEFYGQVDTKHFDHLDRIFREAKSILDVGCGTGRDCAYLLRKGKNIFGIDGSAAMLDRARMTFEAAGLDTTDRLIETALPNLQDFADASFDGILCNAVLMHLPGELLFDSVYALKRVLKPGGTLLFIIPETRPGIDPKTMRDPEGRLYNHLPPASLQLLFERVGFRLKSSETSPDPMGRPGYTWNRSVLRRMDDTGSRPLQLVESILNRDNKVATYKLALFRALAEIAQTQHHLAKFLCQGKVALPVSALAEKWLLYYWPLFDTLGGKEIRQATGRDVAIRTSIYALIEHYQSAGGMEAFYVDWKSNSLRGKSNSLARTAFSKLAATIWTMPAKHAGAGHYSVFQYDKSSKSLLMDASLWRELCLMGSWIQDATVLRWAELTEQINKGAVRTSEVVECLLTTPNAARNVADARRYFESLPERTCVWTERSLKKSFAVDHAMPFALWRNNDLWNLFPADSSVNQRKSDKLPSYALLKRRRDGIIFYWRGLHEALESRFECEAQTLLGREPFRGDNWERGLFARFVEAFEMTAHQRGAERWEPSSAKAKQTSARRILQRKQPPYPEVEERIYGFEPKVLEPEARQSTEPTRIPFCEVGNGVYTTHLPVVAKLAAGAAFHGFETDDLSRADDMDWISVPAHLIRPRRFVVQVAGDSMEPTLHDGQYAVFEYHRSPRSEGQIVIAILPDFGAGIDGTETIKRLRQSPTKWIFEADNPKYPSITVPKHEIAQPILGCFVGRID